MAYTEIQKLIVWRKAKPIPGYDKNIWRYDPYGNPIKFSDYGNRQSRHVWEIDHFIPKALGGSNSFLNLRPLQGNVNASLGGRLSNLNKGRY